MTDVPYTRNRAGPKRRRRWCPSTRRPDVSRSGPADPATVRTSSCCCPTAVPAPPTNTSKCSRTSCPRLGIELIYYDQLGSHHSDQRDDPTLWDIDRFVDEVEQVRVALGLSADNFFLLGHSWGGILAIDYALKHQRHLKGLIVSNMMASIPAYNRHAETTLMPTIDPSVLSEIRALEAAQDYENPRYMALLIPHHYEHHVLRGPHAAWPDAVHRAFGHLDSAVYIPMQGPSELGASGALVGWDRVQDLTRITVPTLTIGARHDTMDPAHMKAMADALPNGRHLHCPDGSHMAMYDDQAVYMAGLIAFLKDVDLEAGSS